jgi:hypothetical protein
MTAGRLLMRGEAGYEQARTGRIFNARRPGRFPAAILAAAGEDDVIDGVRLQPSAAGRSPCAPAGTPGPRGACAMAPC